MEYTYRKEFFILIEALLQLELSVQQKWREQTRYTSDENEIDLDVVENSVAFQEYKLLKLQEIDYLLIHAKINQYNNTKLSKIFQLRKNVLDSGAEILTCDTIGTVTNLVRETYGDILADFKLATTTLAKDEIEGFNRIMQNIFKPSLLANSEEIKNWSTDDNQLETQVKKKVERILNNRESHTTKENKNV